MDDAIGQETQTAALSLFKQGVAVLQTGRLAEAIVLWRQSVAADPTNVAAWNNIVLGFAMLGDGAQALVECRRGRGFHAQDRGLLKHEADLAYRLGDFAGCAAACAALLAEPGAEADFSIQNNTAMSFKALGRFDEAEAHYLAAIKCADASQQARARFNLSNLLLMQGRWREGFAAYEARLALPEAMGAPWGLQGFRADLPAGSRVLLWSEQGLGDAIMFLRFAPLLAAKGYRLFAHVPGPLKELAASVVGIEAAFCALDDRQPMDAALALGSLPYILGLDQAEFCNGVYLTPPAQPPFLPPRDQARRRIGLVWAGKPTHANDHNRSMSLVELAPLFALPGVDWFSLQMGPEVELLRQSPFAELVKDLSPLIAGLSDTARLMQELDLIISVDTAPAHLAGALGVPVWVLLPAVGCDWRWLSEGATTVWYSSMRFFRQSGPGAWPSVVAAVAKALAV